MAKAKPETKPAKKKAADEAVDVLRHRILAGQLPAGTMLPPERELADQLGVSRLTLRSALASLEAQGLIEKVHGAGNRVLDFREHGGVELVAHLAALAMDGRETFRLLAELLEFRRVVAVELLGLVAQRATAQELRGLRSHLASQHEVLDDPEAFVRADLTFARLLVRAAHNLTLELLYNTVQRLVMENPQFEAAFLVNSRATLKAYEMLLELLEARDPKKVREAARAVLEPLDRVTLDRLATMSDVFVGDAAESVKETS
ncbi:MAG: GntR family transcriptional regulator [Myxococcota bacterium]